MGMLDLWRIEQVLELWMSVDMVKICIVIQKYQIIIVLYETSDHIFIIFLVT